MIFFSSHDVLPIAMGARLEDYEVAAPHKSFLHVDQFSGPRQLAKFLHKLDRDEDLYNEYFKVRREGSILYFIEEESTESRKWECGRKFIPELGLWRIYLRVEAVSEQKNTIPSGGMGPVR